MVGLENGNVDEEGIVVRGFLVVPDDVSLACVDKVAADDEENKGVEGLEFDTGALEDSTDEALGRGLAVVGPDDAVEAKLEGVLAVNVNGTDGLIAAVDDDGDANKDDLIRPGELAPDVSLGLGGTLGVVELDAAGRSKTGSCGGTNGF